MKKTAPIPFAGSRLAECRHVCAFFNDDDEAYRVLLPFITDGFRCNHKAVHVVNPGHPMVIIGGMLRQNPFYVPPEQFLLELRERRTGPHPN